MAVRTATLSLAAFLLAVSAVAAAPAQVSRDRQPPTTPTELRITASSSTSISLAWNPSTDNSSNWWYCVQVDGQGCFRVNPPRTSFTYPKLLPSRTTSWTVVAVDAAGNRSGSSNAVRYTTPADETAPSPPPGLTVTAVYPTRIAVSWTASVDDVTQVFYTLYVDGMPRGEAIGPRSATILNLPPSTTHELFVDARDGYGNTTRSNVLSVTTPAKADDAPPSPPTNLRFSVETSPPEAWLDWDQSTDDTDPQDQILYEVYLNGERVDDGVIGEGSTITYCRTAGTTEIVIRAVDTSGNVSLPSNALSFAC